MTGYNYHVVIPAGTAFKEPFIEEHAIKPGMITMVHVDFPYGCNRFVYIQVWMGETPLVPDDKGEWLRGNGQLYPYAMDFIVNPLEGKLKIIGASPGATLDHQINVGISHERIDDSSERIIDALTTMNESMMSLEAIMKKQTEAIRAYNEMMRRLIHG